MTGRLQGKVAFISGAGSGIGRASADIFAREGASIVAADRDARALAGTRDLVLAHGVEYHALVADLTDEQSVEAIFAQVSNDAGRLDILYNCVGGSTSQDSAVDTLAMDVLDDVLSLELRTAVLCSKFAIPLLVATGGGSIVNMTSYVAFRGVSQIHAYSAAKGAIVSLTRAMAGTYARSGVRVNAIAPGIALSERAAARLADPNVSAGLPFSWEDYPFATGQPVDIANVALFLVSDEARMVTGHTIMADGGLTSY